MNVSRFIFAARQLGNRPITVYMTPTTRDLAQKQGLDPNKWFNNVEIVVADKIGQETTSYVRNIYKYYVSYKLIVDAMETSRKAREKTVECKGKADKPIWSVFCDVDSPK